MVVCRSCPTRTLPEPEVGPLVGRVIALGAAAEEGRRLGLGAVEEEGADADRAGRRGGATRG